MMSIRGEFDYNLIEFEEQVKRARGNEGKIPIAPMSPTKVRSDWTGNSKEQVVAKPDFIPVQVRKNPRPYLQMPGRYEPQAKAAKQEKQERIIAARAYVPPPQATPTPTSAQPQPPVDAPWSGSGFRIRAPPILDDTFGRATHIWIDTVNDTVKYVYEHGHVQQNISEQHKPSSAALGPVPDPSRKRPASFDDAGPASVPIAIRTAGGSDTTVPPPHSARHNPKRLKQTRPALKIAAKTDEEMLDALADFTGSIATNLKDADDGERRDDDSDADSQGDVRPSSP